MSSAAGSNSDAQGQTHIPVIDISGPNQQAADELVSAAATNGFIFIKSTGIDLTPEITNRTFEIVRGFFRSPIEEKRACPMQQDNRGWTSMYEEVLDPGTQKKGDPKEAFNLGPFIDGKAQQPLTPTLKAVEPELAQFSDLCNDLCRQILRLFALGLKIDPAEGGENWFSSRHDPSKGPSGTILRLLHYPHTPHTSDAPSIRAGAHSDYGSLTLLFRLPSQPGLEILTRTLPPSWAPVPVSPPSTARDPSPPILVNIGDLLSYWTGGLLRSTVHRVVAPPGEDAAERYSIAFFCHPAGETRLVPVPSEMVRKRVMEGGELGRVGVGMVGKGERSAVTASEHLRGRLAATYGWDEEEKQKDVATA